MNIKKYIYHIYMLLWFIINILIAFANWIGKLRFGYGLGDLIYIGLIGLVIIIVGTYYITDLVFKFDKKEFSKSNIIVSIFSLLFILLKVTLLRGLESRWDGNIFFN